MNNDTHQAKSMIKIILLKFYQNFPSCIWLVQKASKTT